MIDDASVFTRFKGGDRFQGFAVKRWPIKESLARATRP